MNIKLIKKIKKNWTIGRQSSKDGDKTLYFRAFRNGNYIENAWDYNLSRLIRKIAYYESDAMNSKDFIDKKQGFWKSEYDPEKTIREIIDKRKKDKKKLLLDRLARNSKPILSFSYYDDAPYKFVDIKGKDILTNNK